ncbi:MULTISPECIES: radical SAM family heme chaperone HemW [Prevotellaceae]|uniref:Heme chaperone HemW n=2 Tax=Prevotellaceae TaxID=171552 RepID=F9D6U2_PREDD|nr:MULTISPECIES: radical SAM family heme chaperone HemW [Prevotellaceae]AGB29521.1 putative oxygen-independent coproporphyrinogen III oxidase [Prevotella dentalis DSM 3688]EGQ12009.1 putative coproporphyrinogen dehydrogenase [Prevotella dentalis DSM 3688]
MAGLYIHIPFCASRCIYCGFYSTTLPGLRDRYVEALCREMELRPERPELSTIYLGGGTPSQLTPAQLDRLFSYIYKVYPVRAGAEVTMECNPDDIPEGLPRHLPVNRVSMGAQTFDDGRLHFLRRRHTATEVDRAVDALRRQGINNISIDLMFGFPGETLDDWQHDLTHALHLQPEHLSAYSLMYEEGTPLHGLLAKKKVEEISEELSLTMYDTLVDRLTAAGYEHYEISNFARPGFRSRHNSSYWQGVPYIGLGAAAHSYAIDTRQWNVADVLQYIRAIEQGRLPSETEQLDDNTKYDELVMTRLRTSEGIALEELAPAYRDYLLRNAQDYLNRSLLRLEDGRLRLTRAGISISNTVMSNLMHD